MAVYERCFKAQQATVSSCCPTARAVRQQLADCLESGILVPGARGVSADGFAEVHLPAAEKGKLLRFVVAGAYTLLGKLKNAAEEE